MGVKKCMPFDRFSCRERLRDHAILAQISNQMSDKNNLPNSITLTSVTLFAKHYDAQIPCMQVMVV